MENSYNSINTPFHWSVPVFTSFHDGTKASSKWTRASSFNLVLYWEHEYNCQLINECRLPSLTHSWGLVKHKLLQLQQSGAS